MTYYLYRFLIAPSSGLELNKYQILGLTASWSSGNAFVSGAGGRRFILGLVKPDTVLPTARHRCDISSKGAVLRERNDAEMGPANSLHAPAYYSEYNERFDLI